MLSRRAVLCAASSALAQSHGVGPWVDTHIHLFSADPKAFPFAANAPYQRKPDPVEAYARFVTGTSIRHSVIVHPEPYQDDHRYLEYCFAHEPAKDFFRGTLLLDAYRDDTPKRMDEYMKRWPNRLRALRVHRISGPPTSSGPIKDRDLASPQMRRTWQAAHDRGLMIQMHFHPDFAPQVLALARQFPKLPVVLDHLGRFGQGTPGQFKDILALAQSPNTILKFSGVNYSSQQPWPHSDVMPQVRQLFNAFGPERVVAGTLGMNAEEFVKAARLFEEFYAFAKEADRVKMRASNALRLYGWTDSRGNSTSPMVR